MRKFNLLSTCVALALTTQVVVAADYLLDASTMAVGATAGENLIVKEGCLDLTKTTCTEKVKWLAAPLTKVGSLEVLGNLQSDFVVSMTSSLDYNKKGISLITADGKSIQLSLDDHSSLYGFQTYFTPTGAGTGGGYNYGSGTGYTGGTFNIFTITIKNGLAKAHINGIQNGKDIIFDPPNIAFDRLIIQGITPDDRLSEVKVKGLSNTTACTGGSSTTTTPISGTTNTGDLAQIASNLDIKIPRGLYSQSGGLFTPAGSIPVWADLKYNAGGNYWTLSGAGVLPQ